MIYSVTFTRKNCWIPQQGTFILLVSSRHWTKWLRRRVSLQLTSNMTWQTEVKDGFWTSLKWRHFWEQSNDSKPNLCTSLCMMYIKHPAAKIWPQECSAQRLIEMVLYASTEHNEILKSKYSPTQRSWIRVSFVHSAEWRRRKKWRI